MTDDLEITKAEKIKILLTEYKVAQQYTDASADRIWKLTGLLFVTSLGSIAVILQAGKSWVVIPIALGSMGLVFWWAIAVVRESFYQRATDRRMQEIERLLEIDMGLYAWIRHWAEFNRDKRTPADPEASDHTYIWPCWARWLGRIQTWPLALGIALVSVIVILLVAIGQLGSGKGG